jgi:hypothetical protein
VGNGWAVSVGADVAAVMYVMRDERAVDDELLRGYGKGADGVYLH